jgi:hypothetical protein
MLRKSFAAELFLQWPNFLGRDLATVCKHVGFQRAEPGGGGYPGRSGHHDGGGSQVSGSQHLFRYILVFYSEFSVPYFFLMSQKFHVCFVQGKFVDKETNIHIVLFNLNRETAES